MTRSFRALRPLALGVLCLAPALALHAEPLSDTALQLGEVVVTATRAGPLPATAILSSVDVLAAARLRDANVTNAWQLFAQLPGVMLTQPNQGTTSGKFSFRGFNGEGEINAIKLLIDGVPSNSNDGNMPYIDMLKPLEVQAIEVVRGTNDPRYGLHNIAGNANLRTWTGGDYLRGRVSYGSFDTRDLQGVAGQETGVLAQNYMASYQQSSGYREHSDSRKTSVAGKWSLDSTAGRYGLSLRHTDLLADEAGYLTFQQSRSDPRQSPAHNASDGGHRRLTQASLHADVTVADGMSWHNTAYLNDYDDQRYVRFSAGVAQQERDTTERHYGASSTLTWRGGQTAIGDLVIEGGADAQWQDNVSQRYTTLLRARQANTRDQQFDFDIYGAYLEAVLRPTAQLTLIPAVRVDKATGRYVNRRTGLHYDINDYGLISQPKISTVYAVTDTLGVYANWGRTFQLGVGTASYAVNQASALAPSINDGWETGIKFRPAQWIEGRLSVWEQVASNEARRKLNDPANDAENIGRTRRRGVDVQLNVHPADDSSLWFAWSHQGSKILRAESALPASQGKQIDHVPTQLYSAGFEQRVSRRLVVNSSLTGQSGAYLERTNTTGQFGGFVLVDLGAMLQLAPRWQLQAQLKNVFDRYFEYAWWDGIQTLHSPGNGRAVYLGVSLER